MCYSNICLRTVMSRYLLLTNTGTPSRRIRQRSKSISILRNYGVRNLPRLKFLDIFLYILSIPSMGQKLVSEALTRYFINLLYNGYICPLR